MAVTQNPHIGRSRNSFATAIFSKWKDKNTMRAKPTEVANPNTIGQRKQRNAFTRTMDVMVRPLDSHKYGFNSKMSKMTGLNAAVQANLNQTIVSDADALVTVDWAALIFSEGNLTPTEFTVIEPSTVDCKITWDSDTLKWADDQRATDQLNYIMFEVKDDEIISSQYGIGVESRNVLGGKFRITYREDRTSGSTVYIYPYFTNIPFNKVEPNTSYIAPAS